MDNQNTMSQGKVCKCPHHKVVPFMIFLLGVDFLFGNLGWISVGFLNVTWPILIIIIGGTKLGRGMCKCCDR